MKEDDGSVTWRRYCTPTHDLVAKFDKEKDTRYASSILWKSVPYDTYWPADSYPLSYKIREKTSNIILMRLADILLLKAEALVEFDPLVWQAAVHYMVINEDCTVKFVFRDGTELPWMIDPGDKTYKKKKAVKSCPTLE